jgi:hypothetical protein
MMSSLKMKNIRVWGFCLIFALGCVFFTLTSCDLLDDGLFTPTTEQMVSALKEALKKGAENAGVELSIENAFYKNAERYIPLPPDAKPIIDNITKIPLVKPQIDQQIEDLILRINRAAESASEEVGPIFASAITSMTISEAANILKGSNTAATEYLKTTTTTPLKNAFSPELDAALNEPIIAGISAQKSWETLTTTYNTAAETYNKTIASSLFGRMELVNSNINEFVLDKALTAVFNEMGEVEKKIRENPAQFLTDTAKNVFDWAKK